MQQQVLHLTGLIQPLGTHGYMGRIKEIGGIISHGKTADEAYDNLIITTRNMLEYKREEALTLLARQLSQPKIVTNAKLDFVLDKSVA